MERREFLSNLAKVAAIGPLVVLPAVPPPPDSPPTVQAGRVVLHFNGGTVAMSQVQFNPGFVRRPALVATASNEDTAGVLVGAQALSQTIGGISAEVKEPRDKPLVVNWIAAEPTPPPGGDDE